MTRDEYKIRAIELAARGAQLPQTKLTPDQVIEVRAAAVSREAMRKEINATLSNEALATRLGVHRRTIEKVLRMETHIHV